MATDTQTHSLHHKRPHFLLGLWLIAALLVAGCTGQPQGWGGAAISASKVYFVGSNGKVMGLDLTARSRGDAFPAISSGEWQYPTDEDSNLGPAYATPLLSDGSLYVGLYSYERPRQGKMLALDASSGQKRWEYPVEGSIGSVVGSPSVAGGTVIFGSEDHNVYALDANNGQLKWRFSTDHKVWAGVTLDLEGTAYIASLDHSLYALSVDDGSLRWQFTSEAPIASAPLYANGTVYIGSGDNKLYAVDASSGTQRWVFESNSWVWGSPYLAQGTLYFGTLANEVYAVDASTGQPSWAEPFKTAGPVSAAPTISGDVLIIPAQDGRVYGLDPSTGTQRWTYSTDPNGAIYTGAAVDASAPTVYVVPLNQRLIALDSANGTPKWVYRIEG